MSSFVTLNNVRAKHLKVSAKHLRREHYIEVFLAYRPDATENRKMELAKIDNII